MINICAKCCMNNCIRAIWSDVWPCKGKVRSSSDPRQVTFFDIFSDVLSGSRILSQIFSDIRSGILSGISPEILCGWGPAGNALILCLQLRPAEEKEKEEEEAGQVT